MSCSSMSLFINRRRSGLQLFMLVRYGTLIHVGFCDLQEEQRVIEAQIRMRRQELQDEEERIQKRKDASSSSRIMAAEVEYHDTSNSLLSGSIRAHYYRCLCNLFLFCLLSYIIFLHGDLALFTCSAIFEIPSPEWWIHSFSRLIYYASKQTAITHEAKQVCCDAATWLSTCFPIVLSGHFLTIHIWHNNNLFYSIYVWAFLLFLKAIFMSLWWKLYIYFNFGCLALCT